MTRSMAAFTSAALLAASFVACSKPGVTEEQRETKANDQAAQERSEAAERAQNAQAAADRNIAAARADFEKAREDYGHDRRQGLADLDKRIAELEAKARTATGSTKAKLDANLPTVRASREAFVRDMRALDTTAAGSWDQAKANVDREWSSLEAAVDKAE